jgi:hypothetical protein
MIGWTCNTCGKVYFGENAETALKEHGKRHREDEWVKRGLDPVLANFGEAESMIKVRYIAGEVSLSEAIDSITGLKDRSNWL